MELLRDLIFPAYDASILESVGFYINLGIAMLFMLLYSYQFVYVFIALIKKPLKYPETDQSKHYAVLIAARNEEKVLPELLKSLAQQTYPMSQVDVYVVADNCSDGTADVAREMGAIVYERHNLKQIGKGYALELLFNNIKRDKGLRAYDAYMVFDADNVLRANYIEEMDKAHSAGNRVLTSYRNSKNYGKTWISAAYSLWFMRESRHLNNPRSIIGTSAAISGTGFLIDSEIIERNGGWKHFLLTEDLEFTSDCVLHGERVGYCHWAELFDEQPETFRQSWRQRTRWAKGFFQVFHKYGAGLFKKCLTLQWSCFDMIMTIMPALILTITQMLAISGLMIANAIAYHYFSTVLLLCFVSFLVFAYCLFVVLGAIAVITEWKHIYCPKWKAILHLLTFPFFMLSYIPISLYAMFKKVEWKPIEHKYAVQAEDIETEAIVPVDEAPAEQVVEVTEGDGNTEN